jgi:excisionase family DNA binding protein
MGQNNQHSKRVAAHQPPTKLPLLDANAVAEALGTTRRHVQRLVAERRIPFVKVGRFVRFDFAALDLWLDSQRSMPFRDLVDTGPLGGRVLMNTRWPGAPGRARATPPAFASQMVRLAPRW